LPRRGGGEGRGFCEALGGPAGPRGTRRDPALKISMSSSGAQELSRRPEASGLTAAASGKDRTGGGGVEESVREAAAAANRVSEYVHKQQAYAQEEKYEVIEEKRQRGEITDEEARKLLARKKMHMKTDTDRIENAQKANKEMQLMGHVAAGADFMTTEQMLEELLESDKDLACVRWIKQKTGFYHLRAKVILERKYISTLSPPSRCPRVYRLVSTWQFELIVGILMICNGITIGVQVSADEKSDDEASAIVEQFFTSVFVVEILLRLLSDGWTWLWEPLNAWDVLLIVATGCVPLWVLQPMGIDAGGFLRVIQVLRVLRLIRLVRMVRQLKWFRILWTLIRGVLQSFRTLNWALVIIFALLYVFAVFCVYMIFRLKDLAGNEVATEFFGDVPKAMLTLFQVMTLDSWAGFTRPLMDIRFEIAVLMMLAIFVMTMVLVNIITAVIVNNTFAEAASDMEVLVKEKNEAKAQDIEDLTKIFLEIDTDGSGALSKEEFTEAVTHNERVIQKFEVLEVAPHESGEIWELIDTGTGDVSVAQFAETLHALQCDAKAKDSYSIVQRVRKLNNQCSKLALQLQTHKETADALRGEAANVKSLLHGVLGDVREFVQYSAICIPARSAPRSAQQIELFADELDKRCDNF